MWDIEYDNSNPYHRSLANIVGHEADKIVISEGITYIGSRAFYIAGYWLTDEPYRVKEIIIPSGVTAIGEGAFSGNKRLHSVNFPDTVTSIAKNDIMVATITQKNIIFIQDTNEMNNNPKGVLSYVVSSFLS